MTITIRTDQHLMVAEIKEPSATEFLGDILHCTKIGKAKNPKNKIFIMDKDMASRYTNGVTIFLYKGFYLVVSKK